MLGQSSSLIDKKKAETVPGSSLSFQQTPPVRGGCLGLFFYEKVTIPSVTLWGMKGKDLSVFPFITRPDASKVVRWQGHLKAASGVSM